MVLYHHNFKRNCFVFAGVLQPEVKITSYWRGFPKEFNSAISVPNEENGDGYDYYAFAKGMLWL